MPSTKYSREAGDPVSGATGSMDSLLADTVKVQPSGVFNTPGGADGIGPADPVVAGVRRRRPAPPRDPPAGRLGPTAPPPSVPACKQQPRWRNESTCCVGASRCANRCANSHGNLSGGKINGLGVQTVKNRQQFPPDTCLLSVPSDHSSRRRGLSAVTYFPRFEGVVRARAISQSFAPGPVACISGVETCNRSLLVTSCWRPVHGEYRRRIDYLLDPPLRPLERVWKGVYGAWAGCQGRRPGGGARRRAMRPIMAHLTMASEWVGRRS